jgi:exopolysaccharide biosynthesis polyprenyl glycosylphosphotransferase
MLEQSDPRLKLRLIASDAAVIAVVWTLILWFGPHSMQRSKIRSLALVLLVVAVACIAIRQVGLLLYRRCVVRATEMRLLLRVTIFTVVFMLLFDRIVLTNTGLRFYVSEAILGGVVMFVALTIERSVWRSLLRAARQAGFRERRVLVLGTNSDAKRLVELFRAHPEHGLRVIGVAGSKDDAERQSLGHLWLGGSHDVEALVHQHAVSGVVVAAAPMEHPFIDELLRSLLAQGLHVHLSTGVAGMDISRFRHLPMAREPLLYVESRDLGLPDQIAKRTLDVVGSLVFLVLLSPVLLAIALAIKISDHGPVFYRQERGGRGGRLFRVVKFRTMQVNADQMLDKVAHLNTREGALFKADDDPRVTKIGKFLRLSSLDEVPQLFNVLIGEMSLVGPRPALLTEIAQFDAELRTRDQVRPGITGLWQVEARDSPSEDAYKRLDLFYVENWSLMGDIAILLDTVEHLLGRVYRALHKVPAAPIADPLVTAPTPPAADPGIAKTA